MIGGFMLAAPQSGAGKTLVTLALLRLLQQKGLALAPFKTGPDYIDPAFYQMACGVVGTNLDPWAMDDNQLLHIAQQAGKQADLMVVEAMMGLFDGALDGSGRSVDLAQSLHVPVILVVDCAKTSQSIAALVKGFDCYEPTTRIKGLILNKVGSTRHESMLRAALLPLDIPVIGVLPRDAALHMPERHLGLVQAEELHNLQMIIAKAAHSLAQNFDLDALLALARQAKLPQANGSSQMIPPPAQVVAVAQDRAFRFAYRHILDDWRQQGAEIIAFSPLDDQAPPLSAEAIFLPGGYPELHAGQLAAAQQFKQGMRDAAEQGKMIYGECGGYMVLGTALEDNSGTQHAMLDLLPLVTSFKKPKLHLGYRRLKALSPFWAGQHLNAHEFHYSSLMAQDHGAQVSAPLFAAEDANGRDLGVLGQQIGRISGSYCHIISRQV